MERTTAKRLFSPLVNSINRTYKDMSGEEFRDSFDKVTIEAEKVMEENDNVEAALIAELEVELGADEEAVLMEQQKANLAKTANECEWKRLKKEVKGLIQETLWANSGNEEVSTALQAPEAECERVAGV